MQRAKPSINFKTKGNIIPEIFLNQIYSKKQKCQIKSDMSLQEFLSSVDELMNQSTDLIEKKPINHKTNQSIDKFESKPINHHILRTSINSDFKLKSKNKLVIEDNDEKVNEDYDLIKQRNKWIIIDDDLQPQIIQYNRNPQIPEVSRCLIRNNGEIIKNTYNQNIQKCGTFQQFEQDLQQKYSANSDNKVNKRLKKKADCILQVAQEDPNMCSICLNPFEKKVVAVLICKHIFCFQCIKSYGEQYKNNCPLCRKKFTYLTTGIQMSDGDFQKKDCLILNKCTKNNDEESDSHSNYSFEESSYIQDSFIVDNGCEICGCNEDSENMQFCKKCSNSKSHVYCIMQYLNVTTDWVCNECI